ncbi:KNR4/SMI1 homolog [Copidosoma floridanum]|uniref:KNR4/SMI1 homolog n=1 Tax=Copidosoma floridanum TaxID=29053 RepID=UPI0006C98E13|nr:KNR4/SMI1 homolog [Copidosoma floridanum]
MPILRRDVVVRALLLHLVMAGGLGADAEISVADSVKRQIGDAQETIADHKDAEKEVVRTAGSFGFEYLTGGSKDDSSAQLLEPVASSASRKDHHDHSKIGYSVGGPLVNIAQGAAAQAHNFEKNQPAAAAQAAYVAKNQLGQSAGLSAATAAAAFAGKQIIYRGLQQQAYNAYRALESEKLQLQQAQRAATAAASAVQHIMRQVQVITTALNSAQETSQHASAVAAQATAMVGAAKARFYAIKEQLHLARIDFEAAQKANFEAAHAAQVARSNAVAAAVHAAELAEANYHRQHGKKHDEHQSGKLEELESDGDDDDDEYEGEGDDGNHEDHDHHESTMGVTVSMTVPSSKATDKDKTGRQLNSATPDADHSAGSPAANTSAISKDELYDAYDSFPY